MITNVSLHMGSIDLLFLVLAILFTISGIFLFFVHKQKFRRVLRNMVFGASIIEINKHERIAKKYAFSCNLSFLLAVLFLLALLFHLLSK